MTASLAKTLDGLRSQWEQEGGIDSPAFRASRLEALRTHCAGQWSRLFEAHLRGASGRTVVREWTAVADDLIREGYRQALLDSGGGDPAGYAILAQGGYGRGFLNPRSDVDLLFVHDRSGKGESVTRLILHLLYDLGFEVGHAVRTLDECREAAREDPLSRTAMLEARYLAGDESIYSRFEGVMGSFLQGRRASAFVREKMEERQGRHRKTGSSIHLLEPNVKESPGGLRDVHTAGWLLLARRRKGSLEGLLEDGILSKRDYRTYEEALDFLWRVRNDLHFGAGKRRDVLEHDVKPRVAANLGYRDRDGELGVERFMRDYYLHARNIQHLTDQICARLDGRRFGIRSAVSYLRRRRLEDGALLVGDEIQVPRRPGRDFFREDPTRLLSVFLDGQALGARLGHGTRREIKGRLGLVDDGFRRSPKARGIFFRILGAGMGAAAALRSMHDLGILGAYVPEFGSLTHLVQYNLYHVYTADEHTLLAIENLERLLEPGDEGEEPLRHVAGEVLRWDLLVLAVLMHDVGKSARTDDHERVGADMAVAFLDRVGGFESEREAIRYLVRNHLVMSHISQRRDLDDPALIADFARQVGDVDTLRMLYLMTYADLSAVTRTAWTAWKSHLLRDLYQKTFSALTETRADDQATRRIVEALTPDFGGEAVTAHLAGLPGRYVAVTEPREVGVHLGLIRELAGAPAALAFAAGQTFSEITVCTMDKPYRLSEICAVLSANGIDIFGAQAYTRSDGVVLDIFQVTDVNGGPEIDPERQARIRDQLGAVFRGEENALRLFESRSQRWVRRRKPAFPVPTRVVFDNDISGRFTVIDIFAQDAVGLLYRITRTLSGLELDIYTARIGTQGDKAVDAFYVTRRDGGKVRESGDLQRIEEALIQAIGT